MKACAVTVNKQFRGYAMKKKFKPMMEVFDPFKLPFSEKKEIIFNERDMDACCACTACSACSACK